MGAKRTENSITNRRYRINYKDSGNTGNATLAAKVVFWSLDEVYCVVIVFYE